MSPTLVFGILAVYFAILMLVSALTSKNTSNATFFTGNHKSPWILVAYGMIGASISGVSLISVPGEVGNNGFSYSWLSVGLFIHCSYIDANILSFGTHLYIFLSSTTFWKCVLSYRGNLILYISIVRGFASPVFGSFSPANGFFRCFRHSFFCNCYHYSCTYLGIYLSFGYSYHRLDRYTPNHPNAGSGFLFGYCHRERNESRFARLDQNYSQKRLFKNIQLGLAFEPKFLQAIPFWSLYLYCDDWSRPEHDAKKPHLPQHQGCSEKHDNLQFHIDPRKFDFLIPWCSSISLYQ